MSHDFEPPPVPFGQALKDEYQRIVHLSGDSGVQYQDASREAALNVERMVHQGIVEPPTFADAALPKIKNFDSAQSNSADAILRKLAGGQVHVEFDADPILMTVVTIGGGERKAWEWITTPDLRQMYEEREKNYRRIKQARENFRADVAVVISAASAHGSVGSALRAGAFQSGLEAAS